MTFGPTVSGTITLAGPITITEGDVSIAGPGPKSVTISDPITITNLSQESNTGIFDVSGSADLVSVSGLTLSEAETAGSTTSLAVFPAMIQAGPGSGSSSGNLVDLA